jgi:hypothetical protein
MREIRISLARDFSRDPGPRRKEQGPHSGETFRKVLVKALGQYERVVVDLDGTNGIGSSFLDEAFGGLVRSEGFSRNDVDRRLRIVSELDSSYIVTISDAIARAKPEDKQSSKQSVLAAAH